jgi:hypothetical protein
MTATQGERVIGAGVPITIAGEERRLLFDFPALEIVEREMDGLVQFTECLNGAYKSKRLTAIRVALQAALVPIVDGREMPEIKIGPAELRRLTASLVGDGFKQVEALHTAVCSAFDQAIPPTKKAKSASKASARENVSRGAASTAGRSSSSESGPQSSAA